MDPTNLNKILNYEDKNTIESLKTLPVRAL